ncbi:hypothetical protein Goklo_009981, partial [Gossypium klotzschianum]|nr:hypothetical protein [Gossypium klotzschianum]
AYIHSAASPIITTNTATAATTPTNTASSFPPLDNQIQSTSPLSSFYAQEVIHAPRSFLFHAVLPLHPPVFKILTQEPNTSPLIKLASYLFMPDTTFERSDTSPSHLENNGSKAELSMTSPISPMKKLPAQVCPVSLRDARSLVTLGSGSNSNNGLSSFSSGSPCSSPS